MVWAITELVQRAEEQGMVLDRVYTTDADHPELAVPIVGRARVKPARVTGVSQNPNAS